MQGHTHTEVYVDSIRKHITTNQRIIVLIEKQGRRCMPVWIDDHVAYSLTQAFQHQRYWPLPLHNLRDVFEAVPHLSGQWYHGARLKRSFMWCLLRDLGANLHKVVITDLIDQWYCAEAVLALGTYRYCLAVRATSAIALAVHTHAPIYVVSSLLDQFGYSMDAEQRMQATKPEQESNAE